jgi:protein-S-isoprenylcysteine O-methyltransferase Ste14
MRNVQSIRSNAREQPNNQRSTPLCSAGSRSGAAIAGVWGGCGGKCSTQTELKLTRMDNLYGRTIRASVIGIIVFAALVFVPAGTLDYWQGWAFLLTFTAASAALTIYMAVYDPELLARRVRAGPTAEKRTSQKIIMLLAMLGFVLLVVFPVLDHRVGSSPVPAPVSLLGDALIALASLIIFFVMKENSYAASTIQIAEGQRVISTGPYSVVRHPMYAGALLLLIGMPLALGSWYGLLVIFLFLPVLIWRLLDEERFLSKNLPGYSEYAAKVHWRLIPRLF